MEPHLIDYYNETPHGINVVDKMNEELDELQKKYLDLEKKVNKFKTPFIHVETKEEYKEYENIIRNQFEDKIKEFLYDEETGILAVMNEYDEKMFGGLESIHEIFTNYWWVNYQCGNKESCFEKIINELDLITKHKNKEWCESRINIAFESCFKSKSCQPKLGEYPTNLYGHRFDDSERIHDLIYEEIIEDLIHHIFNDEDHLPLLYTDTCKAHSRLVVLGGMDDLISYNCKKCGKLDNYNGELLCVDCEC